MNKAFSVAVYYFHTVKTIVMKILSVMLIAFAVIFSIYLGRFEHIPNTYSSFTWSFFSVNIVKIGYGEPYVTTAFVGYGLLLLFGLINIGKARSAGIGKQHAVFILITAAAIAFELYNLAQLYQGSFSGYYFRIGLLLAAWALWNANKIYYLFDRRVVKS